MTKPGLFRKISGSVFTKLIIVIFSSGIVLTVIFLSYFRSISRHNHESSFERNLETYTDYIIDDLGDPPDVKRGKIISRKISIDIMVDGNGIQWHTSREDPKKWINDRSNSRVKRNILWNRGRFAYLKERDGYRYVFYGKRHFLSDSWKYYFVYYMLLVFAVMLIAYLIIRRILKPIRLLGRGVEEISGGNLEYRVEIKGRDELGELTGSFNRMNDRLVKMLESREQLLLDISHELRTPLTRMKVAMEFVGEDEIKMKVNDDIDLLESMIAEIIESERADYEKERYKKENFDIIDLIKVAWKSIGMDIGRLKINTDEPLLIHGIKMRIETVLKNIFENSVKYSDVENAPVEVDCKTGEGVTYVEIKDSGIGIPGKDLPYVLEPFFRVDRSRSKMNGGFGLGLSLCKKIMDAGGDEIEIRSIEGEGTTAVLKFYSW